MPLVLIVEDDVTFALMLTTWLGKKGYDVRTSVSVNEAKRKMREKKPDLVISDLRLPDGDGISLLKWSHGQQLDMPFIMMTSYAEIQTAVQAMKLGASDYISKPLNPEDLLTKIREILTSVERPVATEQSSVSSYIEGRSPADRQLHEHVRLVSPTDMSVLVTGSSGTGKEYIARLIHQQSNRSTASFVAVDCGSIPKELAASEFFGHIKGSFTGAIDNKVGAFVSAQGGTIFLDEIGNLSYEVQIQLLRALQERKVRPVGSSQEIAIDVRLISATNENLRLAIQKGEFREDLYHRINEFTIRIPDLRERKEDLLLYANYFLDQANMELGKNITGFDRETIQLFMSYSWPGNLRQMKNVIKYATLLTVSGYITPEELPGELTEEDTTQEPSVVPLKSRSYEQDLIRKALSESGNNKTQAARILGIDRKTLYNKMKAYKLD